MLLTYLVLIGSSVALESLTEIRANAEKDDATAQHNLGDYYDIGFEVPQNPTEAAKWFRKSADQGFAEAQHKLGSCYKYGRGVPKDDAEAVKWFRKVAEQEYFNAEAQFNLGVCYQLGEGVSKDVVEASKWYHLSAAQENKDAAKSLAALDKTMTPEQIAEAQKRADEWKPVSPK